MDDASKVKQIFNSQLEGVRTRRRPRSRWWECVWTDTKKGRITNGRETCSNKKEWKKAIEEVKDQLGTVGQTNKKKKKKKKKKKTTTTKKKKKKTPRHQYVFTAATGKTSNFPYLLSI
jgi:hypothetical protein